LSSKSRRRRISTVSDRHRYWGKRDTKLILPTNSSLSVTLDQDHLRSTTTSRADPSFEHDKLWLNGKVDEIKPGGRLATCIAEMKRLRKETVEDKSPNEPKVSSVLSPTFIHPFANHQKKVVDI
jgi:mevalonate pyrophosphate decarboxylase